MKENKGLMMKEEKKVKRLAFYDLFPWRVSKIFLIFAIKPNINPCL